MTRLRASLLLLVTVAAACAPARSVTAPAAPAGASQRPNIIFVFTDDHAAHAISAYGSRINQTPNIDRLAREGMIFRNVFVTNAICGPSRAVIQTGKHSHVNGFIDHSSRFDSTQVTFPRLLQQAGYQTAIVGKWHLGSTPMGYDHWEVLPGQGDYYNPDFLTPAGRIRSSGYATDVVTDKAIGWLQEGRDPERPFMLMVQHKAPHRSWMPGPDHLSLFRNQTLPEPSTLFDDHSGRMSLADDAEMTIARDLHPSYDLKLPLTGDGGMLDGLAQAFLERMTPEQRLAWDSAYAAENRAFAEAGLEGTELVRWKYQRYIQDYLRSVASVDDNLGRLLDYLDSSGLAENTVVIYSSDQGFFLGDHGWYDKRWMYEESLRMPFLVRWPGVIQPGSENRDLVQNLDFAPTFLALAGVAPPPEMQGRSIVPLLSGETPVDWRSSIYYHYYEYPAEHMVPRHYGVRTATHKLIHYYQQGEWELFDLQRDPDELRSVHDDPAYAPVRAELERELRELRVQYAVPEVDPQPSR